MSKIKKLILTISLTVFSGLFSLLYIFMKLPTLEQISQMKIERPIGILSNEGILLGEIGLIKQYPVSIDKIPIKIQQAFVNIEDIRFYKHHGVDLKALFRALLIDLKTGAKSQGASTITMQVARNFFLSSKKTYSRKIKEILLAYKIEWCFDKNKILELYLNKIFLGYNSYGILAASQTYFNKSLDELNLDEIAILAGLPKAPSVFNPLHSTEKCKNRRDIVLQKLFDKKIISENEFVESINKEIKASFHHRKIEFDLPLITQYVKKFDFNNFLTNDGDLQLTINADFQRKAQFFLDQHLIKYARKFERKSEIIPFNSIKKNQNNDIDFQSFLGSFKSYDTLIPACIIGLEKEAIIIQTQQEKELISIKHTDFYKNLKIGDCIYFDKITKELSNLPLINGAIVTINSDGHILTLVGSSSFSNTQFNRATMAFRSMGSTIKSLIYSAAFEQGYQVDSLMQDSPIIYTDSKGFTWRPNNADKKYHGTLSLEQAFLKSSNLATLSLENSISIKELLKIMNKISQTETIYSPSIFLGSYELTPLHLSILYSSFINKGLIFDKVSIFKKEKELSQTQLFSEQAVYLSKYLQQKALEQFYPNLSAYCGGKTGSSNDLKDVWYAGFHGTYISIVWLGYDSPRSCEQFASKLALPLWAEYVQNLPKEPPLFEVPCGISFKKISNSLKPFWIR